MIPIIAVVCWSDGIYQLRDKLTNCCWNIQTTRVIHKHCCTYETIAAHITDYNCTSNVIQVYLWIGNSRSSTLPWWVQLAQDADSKHLTQSNNAMQYSPACCKEHNNIRQARQSFWSKPLRNTKTNSLRVNAPRYTLYISKPKSVAVYIEQVSQRCSNANQLPCPCGLPGSLQ